MATDIRAQLALLKDLQAVDVVLHEIQLELDSLPQSIAHIEAAHRTAKEALAAHHHETIELEKAKRLEELEVQTSTEKMAERENKLYAIKTTKEYQAALKEVADGKKANREREDRILQMMERLEELQKKTTQLQTEAADKESEYNVRLAELQNREAELVKKRDETATRRPQLISQVDVKIMRRYDFVRNGHPDALAEVVRGVCSGCHMNVPPQLCNEIRRYEEVKTCPSCRRLLYTDITT
ncbi:MAG: hypothetical protein HY465_02460 [Deltaproteobacteria bacterium]|nr:hypothetical protein [Deltaproteobacteria bacterium]